MCTHTIPCAQFNTVYTCTCTIRPINSQMWAYAQTFHRHVGIHVHSKHRVMHLFLEVHAKYVHVHVHEHVIKGLPCKCMLWSQETQSKHPQFLQQPCLQRGGLCHVIVSPKTNTLGTRNTAYYISLSRNGWQMVGNLFRGWTMCNSQVWK